MMYRYYAGQREFRIVIPSEERNKKFSNITLTIARDAGLVKATMISKHDGKVCNVRKTSALKKACELFYKEMMKLV